MIDKEVNVTLYWLEIHRISFYLSKDSFRKLSTMNNFFQFLVRLLTIGGLSLIFIVAVILLNPSRNHRKRKSSTPILKYSYLVYLAVYLAFIYLIVFTGKDLQEYFDEIRFTLAIVAGLLPTTAMLLRRKIHRGRTTYNYALSILHFILIVALVRFFVNFLIFN